MGDGESWVTINADLLTRGIGADGVRSARNQVLPEEWGMEKCGADYDARCVIKIRESPRAEEEATPLCDIFRGFPDGELSTVDLYSQGE